MKPLKNQQSMNQGNVQFVEHQTLMKLRLASLATTHLSDSER